MTESRNSVRVIFTGSNQDRLGELFSRSRAALYEGASVSALFETRSGLPGVRLCARAEEFSPTHSGGGTGDGVREISVPAARSSTLFFRTPRATRPSFDEVLNARIEGLLASDLFQPIVNQMTPLTLLICKAPSRLGATYRASKRERSTLRPYPRRAFRRAPSATH